MKLSMVVGILLAAVGALLPVDRFLSLITSLINPNTIIQPAWVQDLFYMKIILVVVGIGLFALSFTKIKFSKPQPAPEQTPQLHKFILIMLFISFMIGAYWDLRPIEVNIGSVYQDDFLYAVRIAENAVRDGQVTFDGKNITNGFQPLWMIILMFFSLLFKGGALLKAAGLFLALAHAATAYMLYRILLLYRYETAGVILALFWAFNPFSLWMSLAGFETAIYLFMLTLSLWYYLQHRDNLTRKTSPILGILLGITFLSRLDAVFFCAAIAFDYLFMRKKKFWTAFKHLIPTGIILAAFAAPWFIFSWITSHSLTPLSGAAKALMGTAGYYTGFLDIVIKRGFTLIVMATHSMWFMGFWHVKGIIIGASFAALWFALVAWLAYKTKVKIKPALFMILYCIGIIAYYLSAGLNIRYLLPVLLLALVATAFVFARTYNSHPAKGRMRLLFAILFIFIIVNILISAVAVAKTGQLNSEWNPEQAMNFNRGIPWLHANTAPGDVIGAFNAGVYGYFSKRKVVNLDGVINNNAYYAMRDNRLYDYICEEDIKYIIDDVYVEDFYLRRFGGPGKLEDHMTRVHVIEKKEEPLKGIQVAIWKTRC